MIVVKLMGGLGNQMFQYAAGQSLAIKHKTNLKLDLSFLQNPPKNITPSHLRAKCFQHPKRYCQ
jgi:hypothetical protein